MVVLSGLAGQRPRLWVRNLSTSGSIGVYITPVKSAVPYSTGAFSRMSISVPAGSVRYSTASRDFEVGSYVLNISRYLGSASTPVEVRISRNENTAFADTQFVWRGTLSRAVEVLVTVPSSAERAAVEGIGRIETALAGIGTGGGASTGKPRYELESPIGAGGTRLTSVRELTPMQVESFTQRGFKVTRVSDSVPLQSATAARASPRGPRVGLVRRERHSRIFGAQKAAPVAIPRERRKSMTRVFSMPGQTARRGGYVPRGARRLFSMPRQRLMFAENPHTRLTGKVLIVSAHRHAQYVVFTTQLVTMEQYQTLRQYARDRTDPSLLGVTIIHSTPSQLQWDAVRHIRTSRLKRQGTNHDCRDVNCARTTLTHMMEAARADFVAPPSNQPPPIQAPPGQILVPEPPGVQGPPQPVPAPPLQLPQAPPPANINPPAQPPGVSDQIWQLVLSMLNRSPNQVQAQAPDNSAAVQANQLAIREQLRELAALRADLSETRSWLGEVNTRLSGQVTDLGGATRDLSSALRQVNERANEQFADIHKKLADLGQAVKDGSVGKAAIDQIYAEIQGLKDQIKSGAGGLLGFLGGNTGLIIIAVLAVILIMGMRR